MNPVSLLDLVAALSSLMALGFLLVGVRRRPWKPEITLFAFILILTAGDNVGNFLEWAGITNRLDQPGDFLHILTAMLWAFFFYTFLQELTERRLREIQDLDEKILDGSPVAFVLRDPGLRILKVSKAFQAVTGYDPEAVLGRRTEEFMPDIPGRKELETRLRKVTETARQVGPTEVLAPSPTPRYIRENIFPVCDQDGKVTNTLSVLEDITIQVETERRLREIQELDEKILDSSPVAFVLHDLDLRVIRVSSAYEKVTGFREKEVLGRTLTDFMPAGPQRDAIIRSMKHVLEMELQIGPQDIESPAGKRYLRETILPVFDTDGRMVNILAVLEDITEQKHARDALIESEKRYRMLFDSINDGVVLHEIDENGIPERFIEVNAQFCTMTGFSRKELLKMTPLDLAKGEPFSEARTVRDKLVRGRSAFFERTLTTRSGNKLYCEFNAHSLVLGGRTVVLSVVRDITERKEARDRIRNSLAEKETLLREVHHRVKNNLQVISGLLNLQSHYIDDEGVRTIYKESQNRIKTMALIHEELYQREDLARINMADYIQGLTRNLMASYFASDGRIKLTLDLADADIVLDTAIPCGLIVNELVSNALKHAFPGGRTGEVRVVLASKGEDIYELTVSDNGVGLPDGLDYLRTKSMGMQLVVVLAQQLDADLRYGGGPGTTFSLTLKEYREAAPEIV